MYENFIDGGQFSIFIENNIYILMLHLFPNKNYESYPTKLSQTDNLNK